MDNSTYAVLAAVVVLALLLPGMNVAYQQTGDPTTVQNDTYTVDYQDPTQLDHDPGVTAWNDSITVYNESDAQLDGGADYVYDAENGSVEWVNSSATTDGSTVSISYGYAVPSQTTKNVRQVFGNLAPVLGLGLLAAGVGALWRLLDLGGY